jgi:hypothetical protein
MPAFSGFKNLGSSEILADIYESTRGNIGTLREVSTSYTVTVDADFVLCSYAGLTFRIEKYKHGDQHV